MSGLKETMYSDNPVVFWSFDEDRAGFEGNQILDEIDNSNPLTINGTKYELEQTALNDLEITDQYSLRIAADGCGDNSWADYNTYFEAVHSTAFDFTGFGEFSIEFIYNKQSPSGCNFRTYPYPGYSSTLTMPIIKKGSMINIYLVDAYSGATQDYIRASMFGGTRTATVYSNSYPIFNVDNHVVVTYSVRATDVSEYESVLTIYMNGRRWATSTATHVDSWPTTAVGDSWLLCGNGGSTQTTDFHTNRFDLDQVAVYAKALSDEDVANHYRKTRRYAQLVKDDYPQYYWRMDDLDDIQDRTIYADVGGYNGTYYGQISRGLPGPEKLVESAAARFELGASGIISGLYQTNRYTVVLSTNQNYSLEFWFRSGDGNRGELFSISQELPSYNGLYVYLNSKNNVHSPGNIQVAEDMDTYVNSSDTNDTTGDRNNWNDNIWHYVVVRRTTQNALQLWIDGNLEGEETFTKQANNIPGVIHLMGGRPGTTPITGELSEMAFYQYAISEMQMQSRWLFTSQYRISGYTLLQGNPIQATVRFYDHITGELIATRATTSETGEYEYNPATNRYVDVVSFIPDNKTTRYRIHGPVKPAEFNDSHLI